MKTLEIVFDMGLNLYLVIFVKKHTCVGLIKLWKKRTKNVKLKGVFAKNERGYRLNAIKKRFWSLLILLVSVSSVYKEKIDKDVSYWRA